MNNIQYSNEAKHSISLNIHFQFKSPDVMVEKQYVLKTSYELETAGLAMEMNLRYREQCG